ncbi:MAG: class I SAM-dependent methyltransferase [Actinomycetota bacterium]|jgi:SAM-dependent methyltransferase|nr:class I SAM-dependent methyltransferase [Actinomycetota bacterium]
MDFRRQGLRFSYSFASVYKTLMPMVEWAGFSRVRRQLLAKATGTVLEIGAGTGLNLGYYPSDVDLVVAEPNPEMIEILRPKATERRARVIECAVEDLLASGAEPGSFDCVVSTLVLCSVPDVGESLEVVSKLLAPGGRFLFIEHVVTPGGYEVVQRFATPVWKRLAGGCHLDRDILGEFDRSEMLVTELMRFNFPLGRPLIPHGITGIARLKSDFFG